MTSAGATEQRTPSARLTAEWCDDFLAAARKNLAKTPPGATCRPVVWFVDLDVVREKLDAAGARYEIDDPDPFTGNSSVTITGMGRVQIQAKG